jgi:[ribosomal protein S18]-alanine N-acetyltransferase
VKREQSRKVTSAVKKAAKSATLAAKAKDEVRQPKVVVADESCIDAIIDLETRSFSPTDRFARSTWRHLLGTARRRGSAVTLMAVDGTTVIGALNTLLRRDGHTARLYSLAVDPQQRGRGIGGLLVRQLAEQLSSAITVLSLEVRSDNLAARALYERLGFTLYENLPGYYLDGGDGVRLRVARQQLNEGQNN